MKTKIIFFVLVLSSMAMASVWHTPSEIVSGTFTGSYYNFSNNVSVLGYFYTNKISTQAGDLTISPATGKMVIVESSVNITGNIYGNLTGRFFPTGNVDMNGFNIYSINYTHTKSFAVSDDWVTGLAQVPSKSNSAYIKGDLKVGGDIIGVGADVAEKFNSVREFEPGDVVSISENMNIEKSRKSYDTKVVGVVSTDPGYIMADARKGPAVAMAGTVPVKVVGTVKTGDLLTTSFIEGHAMRCDDMHECRGAIIGKALEDFTGTTGKITMLVMPS